MATKLNSDRSGTVLTKNGVQGSWRIPAVPQPVRQPNKESGGSSVGKSMSGRKLQGIVTATPKK